MKWKYDESGIFSLYDEEQIVLTGYAQAYTVNSRQIDSREAVFNPVSEEDDKLVLQYEAEGLVLTETLTVSGTAAVCRCSLENADGSPVETRKLVPLIANGNEACGLPLWDDLFAKMLLVPYDNDQWNRYETVPLRVGRKSYDLTMILSEETREGLLIGALDFDVWKNGFIGSDRATRHLNCVCGMADEGTHDTLPHGTLIGEKVESSRFAILYGSDYRDVLEAYGDLLVSERPPMRWEEGVPFGFNAFAGLGRRMNNEIFEKSAKFLREELLPRSFQNNGFVYTNLDGGWQWLPSEERLRIKDEMHEKGQKAGIYDGPLVFRPFPMWNQSFEDELPGCPGYTYADIMLRDEQGRLLPPVDGLYAMDVTHPMWFEFTRKKFEDYKAWGYDYLKIDFLSHGAMEGVRYDKNIRTGRQALIQAYKFIEKLVEDMGYPFFLSTSIAPLFPYGYSHARRSACDTFGTNQYIEYCLNAQTFGWWENRRLYDCNDLDHIVLLKSFNIPRNTLFGEARARYTTGVISGGVMLMSDDYDVDEARERALKLATNAEVNKIARSRVAFRPVECTGTTASHAYTAEIDGQFYIALFSWQLRPEHLEVDLERAQMPAGKYRDLWTGTIYDGTEGKLCWDSESCDALILVKE